MTQLQQNCPVCNEGNSYWLEVASTQTPSRGTTAGQQSLIWQISCPKCGGFAIVGRERGEIESCRGASWNLWELRALLQERHTMSGSAPKYCIRAEGIDTELSLPSGFVQVSIKELLTRWPRTMGERLNRCLSNLARRCRTPGQRAAVMAGWPNVEESLLFAQSESEARFNLSALVDRGDIKQVGGDMRILTSERPDSDARFEFLLTAGGWERLEMIEKSSPKNPAFVAMWFGAKSPAEFDGTRMERVYLDGIQPGIIKAGYRATRVDMEEHNDSIMDQVLAGIRAAPFVVADFTGHRNGVYFEAGFGRGLGIPVIFTCHEGDLGNAHFDTRHIKHVVWKDVADLCKKLHLRIEATIGKGPYEDTR